MAMTPPQTPGASRDGLFGAFDVRLDPWAAEYGGELPFDTDIAESTEEVDLSVEQLPDKWAAVAPRGYELPVTLVFVDGVRRVEGRLLARHNDRFIHGVIGSYGVGAVRAEDGRAICCHEQIGRLAVLGCGERLPASFDLGSALVYQPASSPREDAEGPPLVVFDAMRAAEAELARRCAAEGATLVIADGPLTFGEVSPGHAVGFVKRFFKIYVGTSQVAVLRTLTVGARSPLFHIRGGTRFGRFSWFIRLAPRMPIDADLTGLARLEIADIVGFELARYLANAVTVLLPRFVPSRGRDPRAPQNLLPIGALETHLRRRLGDPRLIRRRLADLILREGVRA
jgi:uncharacterized protein